MNILIRADASIDIGTGHVMRCLALAHTLRNRGCDVTFVSSDLPGHLIPVCVARGFKTVTEWPKNPVEGVIVDHYGLDAAWEKSVRAQARFILAVDDLYSRPHVCDVLLNQNLGATLDRYKNSVPAATRLLCGPEYALLREEFLKERERHFHPRTHLGRILVSFGGIDQKNATGACLSVLQDCPFPVDVVLGQHHPQRENLIDSFKSHSGFRFHVQTHKMSMLMNSADLAITAGGSTSWERCCLGLPSLIFTIADNQEDAAQALHAQGAAINLGSPSEKTLERLKTTLDDLARTPSLLRAMSEKSYALVDGKGTERVADIIMKGIA